ncbi:cytosolic sulfotransferase 15-like [Olea europaea var. sylvestris]|uniref:Sulfotransferase n=1 Tax=Olea europaea subsp. europaea TaxID=158383 RepID=A0A8S0TWI4_OLEEU|nr:cytosolic sulfotransferase 15-like [Olea europaea var. sylvestris]CAA3009077.1 cytosolic sulfotransferase 12-like [Olea europaea subsp. europaea]
MKGSGILVTYPKSGTIWLKAIMFTLVNRKKYVIKENHPLFSKNPHELIPCFEFDLYLHDQIPDPSSIPSPRLFATHLPYFSLPKSVHNSASKLVYLCRNPKDTFVSLWHFINKLRVEKMGSCSLDEAFDMFYKGVSPYGPFWDHILDYWNESKKNSDRILFLTYENMKEESSVHIKRLAEFLGCPFSAEEEESGMVEDILKLCSFNNLSNLEIYKTGKLIYGQESKVYFRRGEIGDWTKFLSPEMVKRLDQITEHKLSGFGLKI